MVAGEPGTELASQVTGEAEETELCTSSLYNVLEVLIMLTFC